jgi:hypothetical protein
MNTARAILRLGVMLAAGSATLIAAPRAASADTLLFRRPGVHPEYFFEAEPHMLLGFIDPPGAAGQNGFGLGFRGAIEVFDNGFVATINNTIAVGFGLDWVRYEFKHARCARGPSGECATFEEIDDTLDYFWLPIVMQWNFWLSRNWSVFGEVGPALRIAPDSGEDDVEFDFVNVWGGGRFHFSDTITLTMRVGYPTFSVGASFLF